MNQQRWFALMQSLHLPDGEDTFKALCEAYREPHRHYHTLRHITDSLEQFDLLRGQAKQPETIELAIWFHDAIYQPYRANNEQKSADWALRFLRSVGADNELLSRVQTLILATQHQANSRDIDTSILIDVDLAILGADPDRYRTFEQAIRREYRWIPDFLYRRKRTEILSSFLHRAKIFTSERFCIRYEAQARENLHLAIKLLQLKKH